MNFPAKNSMPTRPLGPLSVSAIGLGCMNITGGYGPAESAESSISMLKGCVDCGYTFFDSATVYGSGQSEDLLGRALLGPQPYIAREELQIASKCGLTRDGIDGRPKTLREQCEKSLKQLRTDYIDLYYLHRVDPKVPISESVGELGRLVDEGKLRCIGVSEVCTENLRLAHAEYPLAAIQSEYSLWTRTPERGILALCRELGVVMVPFSPLGRQFLTGKAKSVDELPENDLRISIAHPRFTGDAFVENSKLLIPFGEIAADNNCTMAQLALAWLLTVEDQTMIPIPGTRSIEHARENAGAAAVELGSDTIAQLSELINESTIVGKRYNDKRMAEADAERD